MNYDRSGNASFEEGSPFGRLLCELGRQNPDSIVWRKFCEFRGNAKVEKCMRVSEASWRQSWPF